MQDYWHKQTLDKPLFPDLIWSRPQNRTQAGKLLIVGGNAQGFAAVAEAYAEAEASGIGVARVLLPDVLQKTVGRAFQAGEYLPSTPSGSFASKALAELLDVASWADLVLIAGDLGRNSETAILLEQLLEKYSGQLVVTKDALDYFTKSSSNIIDRKNTVIVASFAQLQKIAVSSHFNLAFTFNMDFLRLVSHLHEFTLKHSVGIMVRHLNTIFVAHNGQVSTTKLDDDSPVWRVKSASRASVWWLQTPNKTFDSLTTSIISKAK